MLANGAWAKLKSNYSHPFTFYHFIIMATAHIREVFSKCSARSSEVTSNWLLVAALLCHLFYSFVLYVKTSLWMNCLEWFRKKEEKEQNRWKVIGLRIHRMEKWWRLEDENGEGSWKKEKENRREKTERSEGEKQEELSIKRSPIERESKRTS